MIKVVFIICVFFGTKSYGQLVFDSLWCFRFESLSNSNFDSLAVFQIQKGSKQLVFSYSFRNRDTIVKYSYTFAKVSNVPTGIEVFVRDTLGGFTVYHNEGFFDGVYINSVVDSLEKKYCNKILKEQTIYYDNNRIKTLHYSWKQNLPRKISEVNEWYDSNGDYHVDKTEYIFLFR